MTIVAVMDVSVDARQLRPGPLTPGGCLCLRDGLGCGSVCDEPLSLLRHNTVGVMA